MAGPIRYTLPGNHRRERHHQARRGPSHGRWDPPAIEHIPIPEPTTSIGFLQAHAGMGVGVTALGVLTGAVALATFAYWPIRPRYEVFFYVAATLLGLAWTIGGVTLLTRYYQYRVFGHLTEDPDELLDVEVEDSSLPAPLDRDHLAGDPGLEHVGG